MNDEQLLLEERAAHRAAHDAPLSALRTDADGHRWVAVSTAFATRANEWMRLREELFRRGLVPLPRNWNGDSRRSKESGS